MKLQKRPPVTVFILAFFICLAAADNMKTLGNARSKQNLPYADVSFQTVQYGVTRQPIKVVYCGKEEMTTIHSATKKHTYDIPCIPGPNEIMEPATTTFTPGAKEAPNCESIAACKVSTTAGHFCDGSLSLIDLKPPASASFFYYAPMCRYALHGPAKISHRWMPTNPNLKKHLDTKHKDMDMGEDIYIQPIVPPHPDEVEKYDKRAYTYVVEKNNEKDKDPAMPIYLGSSDFIDGSDLGREIEVKGQQPCNAKCTVGRLFTYSQFAQKPLYTLMLKPKCDWVMICFALVINGGNKVRCKRNAMVNLMLRNGFIVNGERRQGTPFQFHRSHDGANSVTQIRIAETTDRTFVVDNMFRERYVGPGHGLGDTQAFHFSHVDCIDERYGIMSEADGTVYTMKDDPASVEKQIKDSVAGALTVEQEQQKNGNVTMPPAVTVTDDMILTTDPNATTTEAPTTAKPEVAAIHSEQSQSSTAYKGWVLWAIWFGFVGGSFVGALILCGLFFVFRRTFFRSWYAGMLKRYKCDASGTGGTGAAFTSGDQTSGDTTSSFMVETSKTEASTVGTSAVSTQEGGTSGTDMTSTNVTVV